jgi:hypothetical protein
MPMPIQIPYDTIRLSAWAIIFEKLAHGVVADHAPQFLVGVYQGLAAATVLMAVYAAKHEFVGRAGSPKSPTPNSVRTPHPPAPYA